MNEFWMVYVDGQSGSTHKHMTAEFARVEAERLLRLRPESIIYLLRAECYVQVQTVRWVSTRRGDNRRQVNIGSGVQDYGKGASSYHR